MVLCQYGAVLVGSGDMGQFGVVLFGTLWYWVRIGCYCLIFDSTGSVQGGTGWYLVSLTWYFLVLTIKWYWVIIWLLCQYILKKVEIWLDVTIAGRTDGRTRKDRATRPMNLGRLRWAILVEGELSMCMGKLCSVLLQWSFWVNWQCARKKQNRWWVKARHLRGGGLQL